MRIDHVELFVPDREQAAQWYGEVLGFRVLAEHRDWATENGPLMISSDAGNTKIALFEGIPQGEREICGFRRLAFRVTASDFLRFLKSSDAWRPTPLGAEDVQDHKKAIFQVELPGYRLHPGQRSRDGSCRRHVTVAERGHCYKAEV